MTGGRRRITVRGEAEVRALPDRAVLRARVEVDAAERAEAYRAAGELAGAVDGVIAAAGVAIDRVTTAQVLVQPRTRWADGEEVRTGWRASRTTIVEVTQLDALEGLLSRLVLAGASVAGPAWSLDPAHPAHDEARRAAAADAHRRARAYADGLALALGDVTAMREPGLSERPPATGRMMVGQAGAVPDGEMSVAPEELSIVAAIDVEFRFA